MGTHGLYGVIADNEHYVIHQQHDMLLGEHPARLIHEAACIAESTASGSKEDPRWEQVAQELQSKTSFVDLDHDRHNGTVASYLRQRLATEAPEAVEHAPDNHLTLLCRPGRWETWDDGARGYYATIPSFRDMSVGTVATVSDPKTVSQPNGAFTSVVADLDRRELVISAGTEDGWRPVRSIPLDDKNALNDAYWEFVAFEHDDDPYNVFERLEPSFCGGTPRTLGDPALTAGGAVRRDPGLPPLPFASPARQPSPSADPVVAKVQRGLERTGGTTGGTGGGAAAGGKSLKETVRDRKKEGLWTNAEIARDTGATKSQVDTWTVDLPNAPRGRKRNR